MKSGSYEASLDYISLILSVSPKEKELLMTKSSVILEHHINCQLEFDEKIKNNKQLKEKYTDLAGQLHQYSKLLKFRTLIKLILNYSLLDPETYKTEADAELEKIIDDFSSSVVESLNENDKTLIPANSTKHVMLAQFEKEKDKQGYFNGKYTVRIFNGGSGSNDYHTKIINRKIDTCFTIKNISKKSLTKKSIKELIIFSTLEGLDLQKQSSFKLLSWFSLASKDLTGIDLIYLFFISKGKVDKKAVHPAQSEQHKIGNCLTRCFNSLLHYELNNLEELNHGEHFFYFMETFLRNIRAYNIKNLSSAGLVEKAQKKEKKYSYKKSIAIRKTNYVQESETTQQLQFFGTHKYQEKDFKSISAMLNRLDNSNQILYRQQDTRELFSIEKISNDNFIIHRLIFREDQKEPMRFNIQISEI